MNQRTQTNRGQSRWLNRTVLGIGLASLLSDWSHEIATAVMPAFLGSLNASAAWLGAIEGAADGLSSFAKMASGYVTDRLNRRKPIAVAGYLVTALGTASFAFASTAWHVLLVRSVAWLGRGVRTPVRKALLAGAVERRAYGRAFGFERMMDTLGAIIGPGSALLLLQSTHHDYARLFLITLIPGLLAAVAIGWLAEEKKRTSVPRITFGDSLRALPRSFRPFIVAVGLFGLGDFSHTMLILFATQNLTPELGRARAASVAVGLYLLHNIFYALFAMVAGWLADRMDKRLVLGLGYFLAALTVWLAVFLAPHWWALALIFLLGGTYIGIEETLEDSVCADLVDEQHRGMGFGVLATVNGIGDLLSSVIVGALWTAFGTQAGFTYSAVLFMIGGVLVLRIKPAPPSA